MNKNDIISAVSIEFGLSKEQSEKIVTNIFNVISQTLKKDGDFEIKKFGRFKIIPDKDSANNKSSVKFTPSEKLSKRVNGNFDNLKKIKLKNEFKALLEKSVELNSDRNFTMPMESLNAGESETQNDLTFIEKDNPEIVLNNEIREAEEIIEIHVQKIQQEKTADQSLPGQRVLISEDLIKLHKEITKIEETEKEKGDDSSDSNLWG